jgi:predicted DNA-binding transcriptional regulator YafY
LKAIPLKSKLLIEGSSDMSAFKVSNFGEMKLTSSHKEIIDIFLTGIRQSLAITISYTSFVKLNSQIPQQSEQLTPMNIEIHRGTFSFKVYSKWSKQAYSLELDMIKEIKLCSKLVSNEFPLDLCDINSRFGYHMPICEGVHKVVLRFPQTPGMHVRNRIWHESQVFNESKLGYIDLHLKVEINIELLGWIMMWMDNVQVLEPQILVDLVQERLASMRDVHALKKAPINNG